MKHYCDRCTQCRACEAMTAAEELDKLIDRIYVGIDPANSTDYSAFTAWKLGADGRVYLISHGDFYEQPPKENEMKLEDAIVLARWGTQRKNGVETRARVTLRNEALRVCKARAEELMEAADKKAEAERVLVDIQVYHDTLYSEDCAFDRMWVKRTFSDGSVTKCTEPREYARQLKHTFEQGKKAGLLQVMPLPG